MEKTKQALLLLICSALMVNASAMAYNVGVKSGDWMKYDVNISSSGQSMSGTIKITFQTVNDTLITGIIEFAIQNYPSPPQPFTIDISTWSTSGFSGMGFIIPANLTEGQSIPGYGTVQTGDWNGRKAIVASGSAMGIGGQIYYDQQTGVLLEASSSAAGASGSIKLVDTNLFSLGLKFLGLDWYIWVIIIVVIVVVIVGVFVLMRKRRMAAVPPPPPPSTPPAEAPSE